MATHASDGQQSAPTAQASVVMRQVGAIPPAAPPAPARPPLLVAPPLPTRPPLPMTPPLAGAPPDAVAPPDDPDAPPVAAAPPVAGAPPVPAPPLPEPLGRTQRFASQISDGQQSVVNAHA
ncbi:MAG: hypothetical protein ABUS79_02075 [Pseudomonadota bacterium]